MVRAPLPIVGAEFAKLFVSVLHSHYGAGNSSAMPYRLLADVVLVLHAGFVAFVALGAIAVAGAGRREASRRRGAGADDGAGTTGESGRMKTAPPTAREIDRLVAFLPRLSAERLTPIQKWGGGEKNLKGAYVIPWPVYDEVVREFFEAASQECWCDFDYVPDQAGQLLLSEHGVRNATLDQIKTMLTYGVRGERFDDGHWAAMIESGHVRRLLERLAELRAQEH